MIRVLSRRGLDGGDSSRTPQRRIRRARRRPGIPAGENNLSDFLWLHRGRSGIYLDIERNNAHPLAESQKFNPRSWAGHLEYYFASLQPVI
ncbi:hypothetical protein [Roseomonas sp. 18066]|uniref:hypothetical protein n=1 Tax=Roseomonas sp. 18066 TaxID=2681412 RepID=UPI00135906E8|nr:hypothetical protein [Roseomonas sp. 18066]